MKDKPSFVLAIGAKKPSMGEPDETGPDEEDAGSHMESAMGDFMQAVKDGDVKEAVDAFKDLCNLHKAAYDEEDSDDEE